MVGNTNNEIRYYIAMHKEFKNLDSNLDSNLVEIKI